MTAPARRYSWQALLDVLALDDQTVKARLGLDHRQVARYRSEGLTERRGDELATKAGLPTLLVWPEMAVDALVDAQKPCAECRDLFVPSRASHVYCSVICRDRCYKREYARAKYQTDPEWRDKQRVRVKQARQGNRRAESIAARERRRRRGQAAVDYDRAYYQANRERILAKKREYDRARRQGCTPSATQAANGEVAA